MTSIKSTTLPNGLRVISEDVKSMHSVAIGIWTGVGTRFEDMAHNGAAHMVEHMMFKGTPTRNALDIVQSIESAGGHMNAYTGREITSYHAHMLESDLGLGLEVLADMYINSTLLEDEIERERQVILQEIGMCNDTPDDLVFDHYHEAAYPNQTLGAPILGSTDHVTNMSRDALTGFIQQFYSPARTVISAAGHVDHEALVEKCGKLFDTLPKDNDFKPKSANYQGNDFRVQKDLEQAHFILGFQSFSRLDDDHFNAQALSTLLGGGMSSRLFQEVREKRGLVYSIFSFNSAYQDDGQFGIYAGTGPESLDEIVPVISDELLKVSQNVTEEEVARAKTQLRSGLLIGRESMMTRADQHAKYALFRNAEFDIEQTLEAIDAIDVNAIQKTAKRIFTTKPTMAALGPLEKLPTYNAIEDRLAA
ncbi:MAG: M16 family metallopeptidase [Bdellovibrionales bacterium]